MGDPGGRDVHKVCETPVRCGVPDVQRNVPPQSIIVHECRVRQVQVTAQEHDLGAGLGTQGGLGDADDRQRVHELLMEPPPLGEASLHVPLYGGRWEVGHRHGVVSDLRALRATWTAPRRGAGGGEVQRCIASQFSNEVPVVLPRSMQGVVVATGALQDQGGQWKTPRDQLEQGVNHGFAPYKLWRECDGCLGGIPTPLRTPWTPLCARPFARLGCGLGLPGGLLRLAAHDLLPMDRERAPGLYADEGEGNEGSPGHRLAIQAREKSLQALGGLAGFGAPHFVASPHVDILGPV